MFSDRRKSGQVTDGGSYGRPASASGRGGPAVSVHQPPPPLLRMTTSQSLTFGADDVQPGLFMPVGPAPQLFPGKLINCLSDLWGVINISNILGSLILKNLLQNIFVMTYGHIVLTI